MSLEEKKTPNIKTWSPSHHKSKSPKTGEMYWKKVGSSAVKLSMVERMHIPLQAERMPKQPSNAPLNAE